MGLNWKWRKRYKNYELLSVIAWERAACPVQVQAHQECANSTNKTCKSVYCSLTASSSAPQQLCLLQCIAHKEVCDCQLQFHNDFGDPSPHICLPYRTQPCRANLPAPTLCHGELQNSQENISKQRFSISITQIPPSKKNLYCLKCF